MTFENVINPDEPEAAGELIPPAIDDVTPPSPPVVQDTMKAGVVSPWDLGRLGVAAIEDVALGAGVAVISPSPAAVGIEPDSGKPTAGPTALDEDWNRAQALLESQEVLEARVTGYNQGGLTVAFGRLRGFVPNSHLSMLPRSATPEQQAALLGVLVGKMIPVRILEVQRKRRRLLLSERLAERAWRDRQREDLINHLHVGDRVTGRVRSITSFGVFVDLGGADGLIHLSELTWHRVKHPQDVVNVGDEVLVEVIRVEPDRGRIGLSRKRALTNPWDQIEQRYRPGQLVTVQVTNMVSFGAFAQIEPGIEGLIHISELSDDYIDHPRQVVQRGQEYTARVLEIDHEHERVSLSLKQAPQWLVAPGGTPVVEDNDESDTELGEA